MSCPHPSRFFLHVAFSVLVAGCVQAGLPQMPPFHSMSELRESVRSTDGIDRKEALIIATVYFHLHITGCGYLGRLHRRGQQWVSRPLLGDVGNPARYLLRIDAISGATAWPCGPAFSDFAGLVASQPTASVESAECALGITLSHLHRSEDGVRR